MSPLSKRVISLIKGPIAITNTETTYNKKSTNFSLLCPKHQIYPVSRASKRNDAKQNKTALGPSGKTLRSNKTTDKLSLMLFPVQQKVQIIYSLYKAVTFNAEGVTC